MQWQGKLLGEKQAGGSFTQRGGGRGSQNLGETSDILVSILDAHDTPKYPWQYWGSRNPKTKRANLTCERQ